MIKSKKFFVKTSNKIFIYITAIVSLVICEGTYSKIVTHGTSKPEIWLSGYAHANSFSRLHADSKFRSQYQFRNSFASKNGSIFVFSPQIYRIEFTCGADYPIIWKFPFPEQVDSIPYNDINSRDSRTSNFDNDATEPANIWFTSAITFSNDQLNFLSVNLTCSSVERQHETDSVYIFLNGTNLLEHNGKTLNVSLEPFKAKLSKKGNQQLVLPCRPSTPDLTVVLHQSIIINGNSTWASFAFSDKHLSFDPNIGFTIQVGYLGNRVYGLYKCTISMEKDKIASNKTIDKEQVVYVNVIKTPKKNEDSETSTVHKFQSRAVFHGNASLHLENFNERGYPDVAIVCCSGVKDKLPKLYVLECLDPRQCQFVKDTILGSASSESGIEFSKYILRRKYNPIKGSSDCYKDILLRSSTIVVCQADTVDFIDHFVDIFHPLAKGKVENRSERILTANLADNGMRPSGKREFTSLTQFKPFSIVENAKPNRKMMLVIGRHSDDDTNLFGSFVRLLQEIHYDDDGYDRFALKPTVNLVEYDRDIIYEGEPMIFMCFYTNLLYATGYQMRLNWENGTRTAIEKRNDTLKILGSNRAAEITVTLSGNADMFYGYQFVSDISSVYPKTITAQPGMSSVDCWMPQINSPRWDKVSKRLKIIPSVSPKYLEKEDETIYFYVGTEGNAIFCTVKAVPLPDVVITRNNRELTNNSTEDMYETSDLFLRGTYFTKLVDEDQQTVKITIHFSAITGEHEGEFLCIASNLKGVRIRTIQVLVGKKPFPLGFYASVCTVGLLGLGIICLAIKSWRDKGSQLSCSCILKCLKKFILPTNPNPNFDLIMHR